MLKRLFKRWVTEAIAEYGPVHRRLAEQETVIKITCDAGSAEAEIDRLTEKVDRLAFRLHQVRNAIEESTDSN